MRVGLSPTPDTLTSLPRVISAATRWKAAEDGSPGTLRSGSSKPSTGSTEIVPGAGEVGSPGRRSSETRTPAARSMRSVWSRVRAGSITEVGPSVASIPARSRQDLTCADATVRRCSAGSSGVPMIVSGAKSSFGREDLGSHPRQRPGHPPHRPAADRGVAVEQEPLAFLADEQPADEADQRARVADVDRPRGSGRAAEAEAADLDLERAVGCVEDVHPGSERLDGRKRAPRVGGVEVAGDPGPARSEAPEQRGAM